MSPALRVADDPGRDLRAAGASFRRPSAENLAQGNRRSISCYYFLSSLLPALLLSVPIGLLAWVVHHAVPGGFWRRPLRLPLWARVLAGLVAGEIGYYWGHRWSHEIPFLWRFHSIHHSAEEIDFLVNTRAHPVDMVFGRFCGLVPIYVLGLGGPVGPAGSLVPVLVTLIGMVWGFFIHANLRWRFGPLEWLISTPAFHHWHHTRTGPINRNYSSTLPWLDWIFGTHLPAPQRMAGGVRHRGEIAGFAGRATGLSAARG